MKPWITLVMIATLVNVNGCESRECEHVRNVKGEEICREDMEQQQQSKPAESDSDWRNHQEPRKEE